MTHPRWRKPATWAPRNRAQDIALPSTRSPTGWSMTDLLVVATRTRHSDLWKPSLPRRFVSTPTCKRETESDANRQARGWSSLPTVVVVRATTPRTRITGELVGQREPDLDHRYFDLHPVPLLESPAKRLVIAWSNPRNWATSRTNAAKFPVVEIADPHVVKLPGFDRILLTHTELRSVIDDSQGTRATTHRQ